MKFVSCVFVLFSNDWLIILKNIGSLSEVNNDIGGLDDDDDDDGKGLQNH